MLRTSNLFPALAAASAVALVAAAPAAHGAAMIDFNTPGQLAANFTSAGFTEVATGGAGGSGAVDPSGDNTAVLTTEQFSIGIGDTFTSSLMVFAQAAQTGSASRLVQLGVGSSASPTFTTATTNFLSARISSTGVTADQFRLETQTRDGAAFATPQQGATFTLAAGNFYQFTVDITRTGGSTFIIAGDLDDFGSAGTTNEGDVASFAPVAVTNAAFGALDASGLSAAFRGNPTGGTGLADNFSAAVDVVPEPISLGMFGVAVPALLLRRRRR